MSSVHGSSGASSAPHHSSAAEHNTQATHEFSSAMSSNVPTAPPPASSAQEHGAGPQEAGAARPAAEHVNVASPRPDTMFQALVGARANRYNPAIPSSLRTGLAHVQTRLSGGLTRRNVEANQMRIYNERRPAAGPSTAASEVGSAAQDAGRQRQRINALTAIDGGMPANEAIQTHNVQNTTDQRAMRHYDQGIISRPDALAGNLATGRLANLEQSPPASPVGGTQQSPGASQGSGSEVSGQPDHTLRHPGSTQADLRQQYQNGAPSSSPPPSPSENSSSSTPSATDLWGQAAGQLRSLR